jgi:hypothetical protein
VGLYIKEIAAFNLVLPFVIFYLCNTVNSLIIKDELRQMLEIGIDLLAENVMEDGGEPLTPLSPFALQKNLPNLPGLDPVEYFNLTQKEKVACQAWRLEMESQHRQTFAWLIEVRKEYDVFAFWGEQVLIVEAVDFDSPQGDIVQVIKTAKGHTSYQCSMIVMPLFGIVELDAVLNITVG